ncbi:MAG: GGDEF domain-containing protein [Nannocystaceae bacterium]
MLDSLEPEIIATVCASEMVTMFGARAAEVIDKDGELWASAGRHDSEMICWSFPLDRVYGLALKVWVDPGPDASVWRQQYLDLVSVVRRALKHGQMANAHRDAAERDELTGVLNRRGMQKHGTRMLEQSRARGEVVTAMFIDLDHFKQVNDGHGHDAGDEVLRTSAQLIMEEVRPTDLVCRWGGDEFLVVLRCGAEACAESVAMRIRDAFEPLMREYEIGLSIGLVDSNFRGLEEVTLDTLVREADVCLYRSKKSGRNKTVVAV